MNIEWAHLVSYAVLGILMILQWVVIRTDRKTIEALRDLDRNKTANSTHTVRDIAHLNREVEGKQDQIDVLTRANKDMALDNDILRRASDVLISREEDRITKAKKDRERRAGKSTNTTKEK